MKRLIAIFFMSLSFSANAQNDEINLENFAERLFQVQDENIAYEDIYESLLLFYSNKLNLNKASPDELASLYILSPGQISSFYTHLDKHGKLLSVNELQTIQGFDLETIRSMLPFVTVKESQADSRPFLKRLMSEENNYLLLRYTRRLETQIGYTPAIPLDSIFIEDENEVVTDTLTRPPSRYRGSPNKVYGRFRTSHKGDFSLGVTFEKDAGERFEFDNNQKGFDFYSYHVMLENKLSFDKILIGDYQLQIGQGIVFGAGFSAGKGSETVNAVKRNSLGLKPYTSVLESGFFRGIGLSRSFNDFTLTAFYSDLNQDGNIQPFESIGTDPDFLNEEEFVNSIQHTGFHRTDRELLTKDRIKEKSLGVILQYSPNRRLTVGVSGLNTTYSVPLFRRPNNYNQFEFKGDHNYIFSGYFSYSWQNFSFFGEGAQSKSGGKGAVGGLVTSLSPIIDLAFVMRHYDRDFHSFYGNAFSENSRNINEKGSYWGLQIKPHRKHKLNLYFDQFSFPWLKFRTEAPSDGYEYLMRYTHNPTRQISLYAQFREQSREVSVAVENINVLREQVKRNYIFNITYTLKSGLDLKTKIQSSTLQEEGNLTKGFAIIQDINFSLWKIKVNTRMALFDSDNFANAQFVYENDVLYAFSIPAYIGTGIRNYVMLRYDPARNVSVWIRYAKTTFSGISTTGSALDLSNGNTASEIKVMTRLKF
ncbi:MAG: helix-hairpin-helix domain-containing protein [Cyclobacteriaceae bacterium]